MKQVLEQAANHKGAAFVEIWQNCVIFNDGAYKEWTDKDVRDDRIVNLVPASRSCSGRTPTRV